MYFCWNVHGWKAFTYEIGDILFLNRLFLWKQEEQKKKSAKRFFDLMERCGEANELNKVDACVFEAWTLFGFFQKETIAANGNNDIECERYSFHIGHNNNKISDDNLVKVSLSLVSDREPIIQ